MRTQSKNLYLIGLLFLVVTACNRSEPGENSIDAELINYEVVYLENKAGDIPTSFLPGEMRSVYTKKYIKTSIKGFFGQFALEQVANLRKNTVVTMLNFMGNKVYSIGEKGAIPAGIVALQDPEVEYTNATKEVCGMEATKAVITTAVDQYDVYFIEGIDIKSPNITTPYHFIDHVLCDFRVQLSLLKMQLVMKEHELSLIDPVEFEIPEDYKEVSHSKMESIINNLFTND